MGTALDIAWIGLGEMGARMAPRLAAAGHRVRAFDPRPEARQAAAAAGLAIATTPEAALAGAQVAFSMIPDDTALAAVAAGVAAGLAPGATYIDMSTVSPKASAAVATRFDAAGIAYLRAPVSGSTALAGAGTLTVFASGPRPVFDLRRDLLARLGSTVRYLGPGEEARVAKLVINAVVAGLNEAVGEALHLGARCGLDWEDMVDLLGQSVVASPYLASKLDRLKQRQWLPAAAPVSLIAKDVRMALDLGRTVGAPLPGTASAGAVLSALEAEGRGHLDMSAVVSHFEP